MHPLFRSTVHLVGLLLCLSVSMASADTLPVPSDLKQWVPWVLDKHPEQSCPFRLQGKARLCDAPSTLRLVLDRAGGNFELTGRSFREGWVLLPGDRDHWPQAVKLNNEPVSVGEYKDRPAVWLPAAAYLLEGRFVWADLPELLTVPDPTALIDLRVNEKVYPRVGRPQADRIWVGRQQAEGAAADADRLSLSVYRKVSDEVPMEVTTVYRIEVAGRQREVSLPAPLLDGFKPTGVFSQLPVRLEPDGVFQVQVRPGLWEIRVTGRSAAAVDSLAAPAFPSVTEWPDDETWVFDARPQLRLVELSGPPSIDPTQVPLPNGWGSMPTYRLKPGEALVFNVKRRGDPDPEANQLNLKRAIWLDFDGQGYTVRDEISGTVSRGWRLDALPATELGYLELNGKPQLITRLKDGAPAGVELRQGRVELAAESRTERKGSTLAALGWNHPFQSVSARLQLPPGWKVFSVSGVDNLPRTWLQRWTLFDLFLVLVTSVAAARMWNWRWGMVFLVTLTLLWHESGAPHWTWLNLLAATALLRVVGEVKRVRRSLELYRAVTAAALVLLLIPFAVDQIRTSIYPQLERPYQPIQGYVVRPVAHAPQTAAPAEDRALVGEVADELVSRAKPKLREPETELKPFAGVPYSAPAREPYVYGLDRLDPQAKLQTGPGLPQWQWNFIDLSWNGPVQPEQSVRLVYLPPAVNSLLNWARVLLALLLAWHLLRGIVPRKTEAAAPALTALLLAPLLLVAQPQPAMAKFPPPELLNELERRLLEPPECLPGCASIPRARLSVSDDDMLRLRLEVNVSQAVAVPLPGRAGHWEPQLITVDGAVPPLARTVDGTLHVVLEPGAYSLILQGTVSGANAVQLHFPLLPRRLDAQLDGWNITGFRRPGVPAQQVELTRVKPEDHEQISWEPVTVPPFVVLDRTFHLGLDWETTNAIQRITPVGNSVVLRVPLLKGESVISESVQVSNGYAEVTLGPQQSSVQWRSRLEKDEQLVLNAAEQDDWMERWRLAVSPVWHVSYEGIPPVHHTDRNRRWMPVWQPWPGEALTVSVTRPAGVPGKTATIQSSRLSVKAGQRSTDAELTLSIRSSQGSKRSLLIPEGAELLSVTIDGKAQPIRQEGREVVLPLRPGTQTADLRWRVAEAVGTVTRTADIDLGGPHVNAAIQMSLGSDRWILWTQGPAMGPAVLFWGVVIVIAIVALILGRIHITPLKSWQWFLLGVGLSQVPLGFAGLVVAWFFVLVYRGRGKMPEGALQFNALQVGIALMTLLAAASIIFAVQQGLLGWPSMLISGNQSTNYQFNWYQDRWDSAYPQAWVLSVPLLVYRLLMLVWALWLAFASVSWLRWGWRQYATGGLFRPRSPRKSKKKSPQVQAPVSEPGGDKPTG